MSEAHSRVLEKIRNDSGVTGSEAAPVMSDLWLGCEAEYSCAHVCVCVCVLFVRAGVGLHTRTTDPPEAALSVSVHHLPRLPGPAAALQHG